SSWAWGLLLLLPGCEDDEQGAAFLLRLALDEGDVLDPLGEAVEKSRAEFLVLHFAAAEPDRHLDLIAIGDELLNRPQANIVVVLANLVRDRDFLEGDRMLTLPGLFGFLLGFELVT